MSWVGWAYTHSEAERLSQLRKASDIKLIEAGIHQILNTTPGERRMLPEFGSRLKYLIFDPHDDILYTEIGREVIRAVERWEPRVVLENVQIQPIEGNEHAVKVFVVWRLRTNQRVSGRSQVRVGA